MKKKTFFDRNFKDKPSPNYPDGEIRFYLEVVGRQKSERYEPKLKEIIKRINHDR